MSAARPSSPVVDAPQFDVFVRVIGGVSVEANGESVSIGGIRQRRLLALLVARAGTVVSVDWLAEHLWDDGDRPASPIASLRTYVSRLRGALPDEARDWITTEAQGYRFDAPPAQVDATRFNELRDRARYARDAQDPLVAEALLDEASSLWRGEPFRELEDVEWARAAIERLETDRLELFEERCEVALDRGRHTQITGELAAFTAEHGLRERAIRQFALALHRSGRTTEALRVLRAHRDSLAEQSGLDPSVAVLELEQGLLAGDPSLDPPSVDRPLRGYRLVDEIGTGAFAVVWRAVQPSVDREVAIKQIRPELATQPDFIRRFEAEAHLVARIEHPHIVPLIDFWRDPDSAYLVMRWLRGGTLEQRLDDGPIAVAEVARLATQLCGALSAAHRHGVVHRDVKSGNIMFDEAGNAFLTDFGIALEAQRSAGPDAAFSTGSPAYSSPEQLRRQQLGPHSDIFSLGVVLFECLAGSLPFAGSSSVAELVERQLTEPFPPLDRFRDDVPDHVAAAIARATAKDPADRFASTDDLLRAVEGADLHDDVGARLVAAGAEVDLDNPYKGLRAFDDGDADDFFGRRILIDHLVARLSGTGVASRCVAIVGPSGSGKSSVVRAGLVPALRADAVAGSDRWFVTTMVPGDDPFEALEAALLRIAVNPPDSMLAQLRDGQRGVLRCIRRCLTADDQTVLVVIDQFEEIFTNADPEVANDFLAALAVAVEDPSTRLRLIITLRADFFDRPLSHPTFATVINSAAVNVTPLAPDELEQAIVEPARRVGLEFEPGLVARIAAETMGQASPLPLLQYTLGELFDRRDGHRLTITAYDEIGGLAGALASTAETLFETAAPPRRAGIRRVFGRLVSAQASTADLRRRVPLSDLGGDPDEVWAVERFAEARLVTFDRDAATSEPTVEVAHEALLREWPRLVGWLATDAELLLSLEAIGAAASLWDREGRASTDLYRGGRLDDAMTIARAAPDRLRPIDTDFLEASRVARDAELATEQRRVRRLRRLVGVVGIALVVAVVAGVVALVQRNDAQRATGRAELATLISTSAAVAADDDELAVLLALEAHRQSPGPATEQAVLAALGSSALGNRESSVGAAPGCQLAGAPLSHDARVQFMSTSDTLLSRSTLTGDISEHGPPPVGCVSWVGDSRADRRVAWAAGDNRMWFASWEGRWTVAEYPAPRAVVDATEFNATGRVMLVEERPNVPDAVVLVDDRTGEPVGDEVTARGEFSVGSVRSDGEFAAASFEFAGGRGTLIILDGETGAERSRITLRSAGRALAFDESRDELIVGAADGTVVTVDLLDGEVVGDVGTVATTGVIAIETRLDDLLTVVSSDLVEIVDRRRGPTGRDVEIPESGFAALRSDGRLLVGESQEGELETLATDTSILTDEVIE
ncbi:MAG: protein kinase, partial [Actinomycetota bacterium]